MLSLDNVGTSFDPTSNPPNASGGTFTITASFSNISTDTISGIFFEVAQLDGPGCPCLVLNADGGPGGVGATISVPPANLGPDETLTPGESFTQVFDIGLNTPAQFTFFVNVLGEVAAVGANPDAVDDQFDVTGNVQISIVAPGLLGNDSGTPAPTVIPFSGSSTNLGNVSVNADGSFTYNPPPGFEGTDTFPYTITNGAGPDDTVTVTLAVSDMVWFIDASASAGGDGRLNSPFNCLAGTGCFDPGAADDAGDNIFVADGAYTGGLTLLTGQKLIGDGSSGTLEAATVITLPTGSQAFPTFSGTDPVVANASGDGITVGSGNTIRGLTIADTAASGRAITGNLAGGTFTVQETTISGTGGALDINGPGTVAVSFDSISSTGSSGPAISLNNVGGSLTVSNPGPGTDTSISAAGAGISIQNSPGTATYSFGETDVSSTGDGIDLISNTGATFTFDSLDVTTTGGGGLLANGSGTLNIGGTTNTIDTTTGTGVNISNTDIGASGITFQSVDASGGQNGIVLISTGTGSFTISGVGTTAGSGGTIAGTTGADGSTDGIGIYLVNVQDVSLNNTQINDHPNFAIHGDNVNGFTLSNSVVDGTNGTNANVPFDEGSVSFTNLTGTALFEGSTIEGGLQDQIRIDNNTGTLSLTVEDSAANPMVIGLDSNTGGNDGNDGISIETTGTAGLSLLVDGVEFVGARGDMVQTNALGNSSQNVTVQNSTFNNAHPNIVTAGGGITLSGGEASSNIGVTYNLSGNTFSGADGNAITVNYITGAGTANGTISDNDIGMSGTPGSGSLSGSGILVGTGGTVTHTTSISGSTIVEVAGFAGMELIANGASTMNATINGNNSVSQLGGSVFTGLYLLVGGGSGDTATSCLLVDNNTFDASGGSSSSNAVTLDQVSSSANFNLPSYPGSANGENFGGTASTDVDTYLSGRGNGMTNGPFPIFLTGDVDATNAQGITNTGSTCP